MRLLTYIISLMSLLGEGILNEKLNLSEPIFLFYKKRIKIACPEDF